VGVKHSTRVGWGRPGRATHLEAVAPLIARTEAETMIPPGAGRGLRIAFQPTDGRLRSKLRWEESVGDGFNDRCHA
jgi:hypothetical protein